MCHARRPTVKVKQVGEELLVLDEENGQIHQLNRTASFIWQQCDGKTPVEVIARRLERVFNVDPADAVRDVRAAVEKLDDLGLMMR